MAAEALFALERDEAALPWVEDYRSRLTDGPSPSLAIPRPAWREFLGDRQRLGDWIEFFENELKEAAWREIVRVWVARLAPAVMAAAMHGLIRTSHAVRSLSFGDTLQRRYELAQGLGFWAARYYTLPGEPSEANSGHSPRSALEHVERLHDLEFDGAGPISEQIKGLEEHPEFAPAIDLADASGNVSGFISNLTETFAGIYLANPKGLIAFVHTVTAPSALRMLTPYLDEADAHQAVRYAWQACAGIYSWYSTTLPQDSASWETPPSPGALRNGSKPSSGDAIRSPDSEGLSEPQETAPEPLTMVAAANGYGSVIDDEDVVSMTVTTLPRRPTFLQQARWDAVQKAKLEGMSIRQMARELGLHRDTVRRYIDVESPPTRRVPATLPASTSDTILD